MPTADIPGIIVGIVVGIFGGLAGLAALIKVFYDARATKPDIVRRYIDITNAQAGQIADLLKRVTLLENEGCEKDDYIILLLDGIKRLLAQLKKKGIEPDWVPPEKGRKET